MNRRDERSRKQRGEGYEPGYFHWGIGVENRRKKERGEK
jgi:hypothetical protein